MTADHRSRNRRRGEALEQAILDAAADELRAVGYAGMTIESVARRAGAGKVSIYRRWPRRVELALDAAHRLVGDPPLPAEPSTLRADLVAVFGHMIAQMADVPGEAMRAIVAEALQSGELPVGTSPGAAHRTMLAVLERAAARGEHVDPAASAVRVDAAAAALQYRFLTRGVPTPAFVAELVDEVALPLLRAD
ncbi:TetR/AcrR family transcriptional regulator [Microbacterium sp.]|uniref:TetR/AcrR family transcriptional regulator n=1 Tax=Microbacterium sp. TaxID=51671 RepID=UPI003A85D712